MENLTTNIDPKVEYLFTVSKENLLTNYWEIINILNNLSENDFGSVHYALNDYYPGLIHHYIAQAKRHFNLDSDINGNFSDNVSNISQLYLARLYLLKKNDLLKHYIEIEYSEQVQENIQNLIIQLSTFDNKILATYSKQITIILSKLSFVNFCRAMQVLDGYPGVSIHYVMDIVQYCYSYNPDNFDNDNINFIYANEILKHRLLLVRENNDLEKLFTGSIRPRLINEFLNCHSDINAEDEIDFHKKQILNEIKTAALLNLHMESELELFMSFANQDSELAENIGTLLFDMYEANK